MPRHAKTYDDDVELATGKYDHEDMDDGYDRRAHPKQHKSQRKEPKVIEDCISIPMEFHGLLIGRGGTKLRELEEDTGCEIDIPEKRQKTDTIWITGYSEDVEYAKQQIKELTTEKKMKETTSKRQATGALANTGKNEAAFPSLDGQETVVIAVDVEKFAHGSVIGKGGSRVRDLRKRLEKKEGVGSAVNFTAGVEVNIPDSQDPSSIISVHVPQNISTKAVDIIKEFFSYYEIQDNLKSVKVLGDMSMQGDETMKGEMVAGGGGGGKGGKSGAGKGSGKKASTTTSTTAGGSTHADPTSMSREVSGMSREASTLSEFGATTSKSSQPKANLGTDPQLLVRKPRFKPVQGAIVDRVKVNGFTHAVLPQRTF